MECRITLNKDDNFLETLTLCMREKQMVNMILDNGGLVRVSGLIKSIRTDNTSPYLELEDGQKIELNTIVAVNGLFSDSYSEC